jgi:hypothetical protein
VGYADDCDVYVASHKAGERVMRSVTRFIERRLKLAVNEAKSAVGRPWNRTFLGFTLKEGEGLPRAIAAKSVRSFKDRVRERCYAHFLRNALDYVPRKVDDDCLQERRWFYDRRELVGALALLRAQRLGHFHFERRLHKGLYRRAHKILVPLQMLLDRNNLRFILNLGHGLLPRQRVGDFDHHLQTIAALADFAARSHNCCLQGLLFVRDRGPLHASPRFPPTGSITRQSGHLRLT